MDPRNIHIRPEVAADHEAVDRLLKAAFPEDGEARLVAALRLGEAFIPELALVGTLAEEVVGFILFTRITIWDKDGQGHPSLALAPMAVLPEWQRQGLGQALVWQGLEEARKLGFSSVIVLGHADYYPKLGFRPAENWGIQTEYEVPSAYFLAIELYPGGLNGISGMVEYAPEFAQL